MTDPELGREYILYRPSSYDRAHSWPLLVVCHSGFPDSPNRRIREWTQLAEEFGMIVIAPKLTSTTSSMSRASAKDPQRRREDERCILSAVQHARAGHNVSEDRIFLHGFAGGAEAALSAGLKNPVIFRAINVTQPRFDAARVAEAVSLMDPHQPIYVNYRAADVMTGKMGRECADWLRSQGADLRADSIGGPQGGDARRAIEFFQDVLRTRPWMHVRVAPTESGNPLEVRFQLRSITPPARFHWRFGDGDESPVADPVHTFAKPGAYRVGVTVEWPTLGEHTRLVDLALPSGTLRPARGPDPR